MAIAIRKPLFQSFLLAAAISLIGCGGGSSSNSKPSDTTPDAISFTASTNAEPNAVVTSPTVAISGIDTAAAVSISGGEYSINGGTFTSATGTVTNGQTVTVRITASDKTNTPKEATVTVGGVSAKFIVTTLTDVKPDTFSFAAKTNAELNQEYFSEAITVKGIDVAVPVSITGGTYSIAGGEFTATAGTVSANQTITVKTTAGNDTEITKNAVLIVGGVRGTFTVTTIADTTPPVAEFKFPTPYTMSEANSVKVRGTATDKHAISRVKLLVGGIEIEATPKSETDGVKDFSSWTATVPLTANAENEIKVIATDDRNNTTVTANANKVTVRQADVAEAFPDEVNQFVWLPESITLDQRVGRNHLLMSDHDKDIIYSIDLATGERSEFLKVKDDDCPNHLEGITLDAINNKLYAFCDTTSKFLLEYNLISGELQASYKMDTYVAIKGMAIDRNGGRNQLVLVASFSESWNNDEEIGAVYRFDLDTKTFSILSANKNQLIPIVESRHITVDGDRYFVISGAESGDADTRKVISVDALTGARSILSSNAVGTGDLFSNTLPNGWTAVLMGLHAQPQLGRVLLNEVGGKLFSVDMATGNRSVFKDLSYVQPNADQKIINQDIVVDDTTNIAYIDDQYRQSILAIDLITQEKVILSKSKNNF